MIFIIACIVSFLPYLFLYLWLRNLNKNDEAYRKLCSNALIRGVLCVFPVILFSGITYFLIRMTRVQDTNPLLYQALYKFIVLALVEETVKYLAFRKVLKKTDYPFSWLDVTVCASIVGLGFGALESVIYAIGASVPVVLIRGFTVPHVGYGFLVGYFYGKAEKTGKPFYKWVGFGLSWLLHGMYDFSLSDEFMAINDNLVVVPFILVFIDIVLVIMLIAFVRKSKKREEYRIPLPGREIPDENQKAE